MRTPGSPPLDLPAAIREGARGAFTCRKCKRSGPAHAGILVVHDGAVVFAVCVPCILCGLELTVARGERGVVVSSRQTGQIEIASANGVVR